MYSRIHTKKEAGGLDTASVTFYAANVAVALAHLHSKDIIYRDLKPGKVVHYLPYRRSLMHPPPPSENILVDRSGYLKVIYLFKDPKCLSTLFSKIIAI